MGGSLDVLAWTRAPVSYVAKSGSRYNPSTVIFDCDYHRRPRIGITSKRAPHIVGAVAGAIKAHVALGHADPIRALSIPLITGLVLRSETKRE